MLSLCSFLGAVGSCFDKLRRFLCILGLSPFAINCSNCKNITLPCVPNHASCYSVYILYTMFIYFFLVNEGSVYFGFIKK